MRMNPDNDLAQAKREFDAEMRRAGVSLEEMLDQFAPEPPAGAAGALSVVGFDIAVTMPVLRSLPDGAGTAAFLARFLEHVLSFGGQRFDSD